MTISDKITAPVEGLASDFSHGGQIQNTGSEAKIKEQLFGIAAATGIANAETERKDNIDIANCSQICLPITFSIGSLTNASLVIEFTDLEGTTFWHLTTNIFDISDAAIVPSTETDIIWTADFAGYVSFPNPGFPRMRLLTKSTGTITNSAITVWLFRGWGYSPLVHLTQA
jgi:hypothetical protein